MTNMLNFCLTPMQRTIMLDAINRSAQSHRGLYYLLRKRNSPMAEISKREWENTFGLYKLLRDNTIMGSLVSDPGVAMCFFKLEIEPWQHDLLTMTLYGNRMINRMLAEDANKRGDQTGAMLRRMDAANMTRIIDAFEGN